MSDSRTAYHDMQSSMTDDEVGDSSGDSFTTRDLLESEKGYLNAIQTRLMGIYRANRNAPAHKEILEECFSIMEMLLRKNREYGNSALDPVRVFSDASATEQILVRMDDKLSRIRTSDPGDEEDPLLDLVGYIVLLMIAREQDGSNV